MSPESTNEHGNGSGFGDLIVLHYAQLRAIAANRLRNFRGQGRGPTSLAQEASVRLLSQRVQPQNEGQLLAVASTLLHRVLVDGSRRAKVRRDASRDLSSPSDATSATEVEEAESARKALDELRQFDARKAEVLTLHAVCALPVARVARVIGVSVPTVERDLRFARAWMAARMTGGAS